MAAVKYWDNIKKPSSQYYITYSNELMLLLLLSVTSVIYLIYFTQPNKFNFYWVIGTFILHITAVLSKYLQSCILYYRFIILHLVRSANNVDKGKSNTDTAHAK